MLWNFALMARPFRIIARTHNYPRPGRVVWEFVTYLCICNKRHKLWCFVGINLWNVCLWRISWISHTDQLHFRVFANILSTILMANVFAINSFINITLLRIKFWSLFLLSTVPLKGILNLLCPGMLHPFDERGSLPTVMHHNHCNLRWKANWFKHFM